METVAVTGAAGLVGRFVVDRLSKNENVKEIRMIDRNECHLRIKRDNVNIRQMTIDMCEAGTLERALAGCTTVVHCAHPPIPVEYQDKEERRQMWRDSVEAVEILMEKMLLKGVNRLVYVGDAYSALPVEDNYGLGAEMFGGFQQNYLLGEYGEARTRAEMFARTAVAREDNQLVGIFLRPVHVHGEGKSSFLSSLQPLAEAGTLPYFEGERRGMHQFIYAGNLAGIIEKSIFSLSTEAEKFNGEIVYCLDETCAYPVRDFLSDRLPTKSFNSDNVQSFTKSWFHHYFNQIRFSCGLQVPKHTMAYPVFRLLFEKTVGFSNKTLRLLMDYTPEIPQSKALKISSGDISEKKTFQ
ncbi:unnamed protein product [Auanema sp. JU1783]|nr:unnamed protein product [Auanema sp. JU1783]